jgi:hypothetical protein
LYPLQYYYSNYAADEIIAKKVDAVSPLIMMMRIPLKNLFGEDDDVIINYYRACN